jgi:hypothetical protein
MGAYVTTTAARRDDVEARAWAMALRIGVWGYGEMAAELSISEDVARDLCRKWLAEGRARVQRGGTGAGRKLYELTSGYREPTDRRSVIEFQMWTAMRGLVEFGPVALASHCDASFRVEDREASEYCQALLRGGYLKVKQSAVPGIREAAYRLVRDTGPRAPRERRVTAIWDPNEAAYAYVSGVGRVSRAK